MLESKAFPAHFLLTYVQTQTNTLVYIIHWGICCNFPLCWPSLHSVLFWVVCKLISWQLLCYICLLINTKIDLPLACSEHLLSQFSANSAAPNLRRLIFYDRDLQKPTLGPTTARNCQTCAVKEEFLSSPLIFSWNNHLYFFLCPWTAGWEAGSRTAGSSSLIQELKPELKLIPLWPRPFIWKSFGVGRPANSSPFRDSDSFGDDELLLYSLTNLLIICLAPKGKKNDRKL